MSKLDTVMIGSKPCIAGEARAYAQRAGLVAADPKHAVKLINAGYVGIQN